MGSKGDSSVKRYFCDKCGVTADNDPFVVYYGLQNGDKERCDLCGKCFDKFYDFITNAQDKGDGEADERG